MFIPWLCYVSEYKFVCALLLFLSQSSVKERFENDFKSNFKKDNELIKPFEFCSFPLDVWVVSSLQSFFVSRRVTLIGPIKNETQTR